MSLKVQTTLEQRAALSSILRGGGDLQYLQKYSEPDSFSVKFSYGVVLLGLVRLFNFVNVW